MTIEADELIRVARERAVHDEIPLWVALRRALEEAAHAGKMQPGDDVSPTIGLAWEKLSVHVPPAMRVQANTLLARELREWLRELERENERLAALEDDLRATRQQLIDDGLGREPEAKN